MLARSMTINLHQQNFTALQFYLDLEAKVCEALVLKRNQVFVKTASKQPQETKCIFDMIFEWKYTSKRHLRPYWPQMVSELQDEFWMRQSKIHLILIRQPWRILWSSDVSIMGIFWILTKFWISKSVINGHILSKKTCNSS